MKKPRGLLSGALLLSAAAIAAKVISALYRIPLTNILGAEGMGLYQLVFPIYAVLLTLSSGGIPISMSRLIAEKRALGESASGILKAGALIVFVSSLLSAAAIFALSNFLAAAQGNGEAAEIYKAIAPAVFFASGIAFFKGWAQGNMDMVPSSLALLVEQAAKLAAGLALASYLLPRGISYAVSGAVFGIVIAEAAAFIVTAITVAVRHRAPKDLAPAFVMPRERLKKEHIKLVVKTASLITIGTLLIPFSQFIDSFLIINLLKSSGESTAAATSGFGILTAPVASLINLPIVCAISLAIVIVPAVSASRAERNLDGVLKKSALSVKVAYVIGLPASLLIFAFATPILNLLYPALSDGEIWLAARLLRVAAFEIIFMSGIQIYTALLQALDRTIVPVRNLAASVALKVILTLFLVPRMGVLGAVTASLSMAFTAWLFDVIYIKKYIGNNQKLMQNISVILSSGVIMVTVAVLFARFIESGTTAFLIGAPLSFALYLTLISAFKVFDAEEIEGLPIIGRLVKPAKGTTND